MTITLEDDRLVCRFPEVHEDAICTLHLQRTLRIPDDGRDYFLPPGLGAFPLRHLDDFAARSPAEWLPRGGVVMPMYQAEALWISFGGRWGGGYPCAVKIGTGKVNAVSGEPWVAHLNRDPQDYVVLPEQPWLDGYCVEKVVIRQFVAMPLGQGHSVEEQLTGEARWGGLQIQVYPMKAARYRALHRHEDMLLSMPRACSEPAPGMGLAPGGRMKQEIYKDRHALEDWDQRHAARCFVTIANSLTWHALTGERPPTRLPTAADYAGAGLPWFDYYALDGAARLAAVESVDDLDRRRGRKVRKENGPLPIARVVRLRKRRPGIVREAAF